MPRVIAPLEQEPESKQELDTAQVKQIGEAKKQEQEGAPYGVIITAEEMEKAIFEFNQNGKNDLTINPSLAERIRQYLAYQEELTPLFQKLAERLYLPYLEESNGYIDVTMYVNNTQVNKITLYKSGVSYEYQVVTIQAFKQFLCYLKNPYAIWIENKRGGVNIATYVHSQGGTFMLSTRSCELRITI